MLVVPDVAIQHEVDKVCRKDAKQGAQQLHRLILLQRHNTLIVSFSWEKCTEILWPNIQGDLSSVGFLLLP